MNNLQKVNETKKLFFHTTQKEEAHFVTITPRIAQELLEKTNSEVQRKVDEKHVAFLVREMKKNQFKFNGVTIKQDKKGNIIDGQHRLHACIKSGKSFDTLFVKGLETKLIKTIDTGYKPRSFANILEISHRKKYKYANTIASVIKMIHKMVNGSFSDAGDKSMKSYMSSEDFLKWFEANPKIYDHVVECKQILVNGDGLMNHTIYIACKWILDKHNKDKSDMFFAKLASDIGHTGECITYFLRKKLMKAKFDNVKLTTRDQILLIFRCWNAFVDGKVLTQLYIPKKMPKIKK
jgi:hypothetical protein